MRVSLLWLLSFLCVMPASADWLVGRDGERIETRGAWSVKRTLVIFTSANGSLSSLRLADVDLEASARATAKASSVSSAATDLNPVVRLRRDAQSARREPVLVLTTKDVGRAAEPVAEERAAEVVEQDSPEESEPPPIEVISWRQAENVGVAGLEILGTLRNDSPNIVTGVGVQVILFDHQGELIARRDAFLDAISVAARATVGFRALFPGVEVFEGEPVFEVRARELVLGVVAEDRGADLEP